MLSSHRQKKLLQRFLAAIAAFLFVVSDLIIPVSPANAFVPAPVVPLIQAAAPAAVTASGTSVLLPLVVGGLVIGAAVYFWSQSQTEQAQEMAKGKYCSSHPNAVVCGSGIPVVDPAIKGIDLTGQSGTFRWVQGKHINPDCSPGQDYRIYYDPVYDYIGPVIHVGPNACPGFGKRYKNSNSDWQNWSQSERDAATGLLTSQELEDLMKSNPGGSLTENQQLNDGAWAAPNETSDFSFYPGPITISAPDFDGDGQPDSSDPDDDNDSTPDVSDPEPNNPNVPAPAPNPSPSPSPNPSPTTSPPPPDPDSPPPAPPGPVTFTPVTPATFSGVNFVSYEIVKFSDKFPFDIFGDLPTDTPNECPTFSFFGQTQELCIIKSFLSALKWPVIIGFLVWGVLFI